MSIADDIPDSKTVWNFREQLIDLKLVEELFQLFLKELERLNLIINEGKIIDASFIEVPKQRNSRAENAEIKFGNTPESFKENSNKKSQKDLDARWTKKNNVSYYGYKNHVKVDTKSKLIVKYEVTDASVHDSQVLENLLDEKDADEDFNGDSAYSGENQRNIISQKEMNDKTCKKGYRNNPLTDQEIVPSFEPCPIIRKLVAISKTRFGDVATFDGTTVTYKPIEQWPDHAQESIWISQDFMGVRLHQPKKLEALIQLAKITGLTGDFNTALACLRTHGLHLFQDQNGKWILEDKQSSNSTP